MSPEQLTGGDVDRATDIFAAGVIIAEALTGERPFRGATHAELLRPDNRVSHYQVGMAARDARRIEGTGSRRHRRRWTA